ncbi:MAG: hypothetical protein NVS9B12_10140 [Vulcanimicrobiaceae bacterium]
MNSAAAPFNERGYTLLETVITVSILCIAAGGLIAAFGGVAKHAGIDVQRQAAEQEMARIVTLEDAAFKYADPASVAIDPAPWKTSLPVSGGTPLPITILAVREDLGGIPSITTTIQYPHFGSNAVLSRSVPLVRKAPPPQAVIPAPGVYANPSLAPSP